MRAMDEEEEGEETLYWSAMRKRKQDASDLCEFGVFVKNTRGSDNGVGKITREFEKQSKILERTNASNM